MLVDVSDRIATNPPLSHSGVIATDGPGDGVLELLVAHGEPGPPSRSLHEVPRAARHSWIRVLPSTRQGAPAGGAVVGVRAGGRFQIRVIDSGSGPLRPSEPVAHVGLGDARLVEQVEVGWLDGSTRVVERPPGDRLLEAHP